MKKLLAAAALTLCGAFSANAQMTDTCKVANHYRARANFAGFMQVYPNLAMVSFYGQDSVGNKPYDDRYKLTLLIEDTDNSAKFGNRDDKIWTASFNPSAAKPNMEIILDLMETGNSIYIDTDRPHSETIHFKDIEAFRDSYTNDMATREIYDKFGILLLNL